MSIKTQMLRLFRYNLVNIGQPSERASFPPYSVWIAALLLCLSKHRCYGFLVTT
jgi:hypothetical protein